MSETTELRYWETPEYRKAYTDAEREQGVKDGWAMPPDGAYPIRNADDLDNAISTAGLGNAPDSEIRSWIIKRANDLGLANKLPETWNADGSKTAKRRKPRHKQIPGIRALTNSILPEVRAFSADTLEIRSAGEGSNEIVITGRPIVYGSPYEVVDRYGKFEETILAGAARNIIGHDVRFLFNHDGLPFARTQNGSLVLEERSDGLYFSATLDTRRQDANNLVLAIERGDINQMSVGMIVGEDSWNPEMDKRSISSLKGMLDVSAVTYPASPATSIEIAKRMVAQAPAESLARTFEMAEEIRSGKVLSAANQGKIVDALSALHTVLGASGFDPSSLFEDDEDETQEALSPDDLEAPEQLDDQEDGQPVDEPANRSLELEREFLMLHARRH